MTQILVDPEVTRRKFRRELAQWKMHARHTERGWLILREDEEESTVEIAFLGRVAISTGQTALPIVACAVRVSYDNYDIQPPSLTFIDAFSREPARPHVGAFRQPGEGGRNVLIGAHPETGRPFLCFPGIREYHSHPQHSGDDWLLHRSTRAGTLIVICERIWQYMIRNILGLQVGVQTLPQMPMQAHLQIRIVQGALNVAGTPAPERPDGAVAVGL